MTTWESQRFGKRVQLTHHAVDRMAQRHLDHADLEDLIETGSVKQKDSEHWWIFKHFPRRDDNLVRAAVLAREALIIKTIMTHWEERDG
ncbi:hypothetical protein CKO25_15565 [Thiocapsa imhoffii]|uniref:DUF4258 domain-containing protein n=1 Tax=Thiocapsa imhoffii TaxID=382777 RepID=A0A9X1B9J9_9GAMM|nr:DUF4258 domain-containing protein [Thiocapsa imhoffii]MBK1646039.1 hypothetical protein [Thiocapsa imhoffii]